MTETTRLRLPYLAAAQSQKHVTHNEALQRLDALVHLAVVDRGRDVPPEAPGEGDRHLVGDAPSGAFAGHAGHVAVHEDGDWTFHVPRAGWICHVRSEASLCIHDGRAWQDLGAFVRSLAGLASLGVGVTPDAANPFAVRVNGGYFVARGASEGGSGDLRIALGKERPERTASHLYQTGWSGRAETGLAGDDSYRIKVSGDGARWIDALVADPATGAVRFPAGIADAAGTALGGLRNLVVNGDLSVAQRGEGPFAVAPGTTRAFDAWSVVAPAGTTASLARGGPDAAGPPGRWLALAVAAAGATGPQLVTVVEDVLRLAGSRATLSFWYRSSVPLAVTLEQRFGAGGGDPATVATLQRPVATDWIRVSAGVEVPAVARTPGAGSGLALRFCAPASPGRLELAGVQLEEGPVATRFERRPPALELLLARRLFRRSGTALDPVELGREMRAVPAVSGAGPFDYSAEL